MSLQSVTRPAPAPALPRATPHPATARPGRRRPPGRTVARPRLLRALLDESRALAALIAPAGYGKTTLLNEWCGHDPRPFAWVEVRPSDDDPARLLATVDATLRGLQGRPSAVPAGAPELDDVVHRLAALAPLVLVLDDVHVLRSEGAWATLAALALRMPPRATMAIAGRRDPGLRLGRLRAQDDVVELRGSALAMTHAETVSLLRRAGPRLTAEQAARLHALTAGWPAALGLAARAVGEQVDPGEALDRFRGDDAGVCDYLAEEVLADLAPEDRTLLVHTAILGTLHGPLCDAVLDREDSAARLQRLARVDGLLTAHDRAETAFRRPPVLTQALLRQLRRDDPRLEPALHRSASAWYEREGDLESAIAHAVAARDADRVAELLADRAPAFVAAGRVDLVESWLADLTEREVAAHPGLALAAALCRLMRGERDAAERWAAVARERSADQPPGERSALLAAGGVVRAALGRDGADAMAADAGPAAGAPGAWASLARFLEGAAHGIAGRTAEARACLDDGARRAVFDAPLVRSLCLAEDGLLALQAGDRDEAAALAGRARTTLTRCGHDEDPLAALTYAVSALTFALRGRVDAARQDAEQAARRLALLPDVAPWYGATVRLALARVELRLSDGREARCLLAEASRLGRRVDGAVALQGWIDEAWALADDFAAGPVACPSVLTKAELRVLRLLPSHLTFGEIAARLHVSANTVKTHAHAIYRKLDATSRSAAVAHARAVGLVDDEITRCG